MKKNLILPIAGKNSRYGGEPKWAKTMPSGMPMLVEAVRGIDLNQFDNIWIVTIQENEDRAWVIMIELCYEYRISPDSVNLVVIDSSDSQAETVYKAIKQEGITGSMLIKDCDGFFEYKGTFNKNSVVVYDLDKAGKINAGNKSYISVDYYGYKYEPIIGHIEEKHVISNLFSVGGYYFEDVCDFTRTYDVYTDGTISSIIFCLINEGGKKFYPIMAGEYIDWGTSDDYNDYIRNLRHDKVIVIDVDDTLCETSANVPYSKRGVKKDVVKKLCEYKEKGFYIIIQTGRRQRSMDSNIGRINKDMLPELKHWLDENSIPYDEIYVNKPWNGYKGFYVDDKAIRPDEFVALTYDEVKKKLKLSE